MQRTLISRERDAPVLSSLKTIAKWPGSRTLHLPRWSTEADYMMEMRHEAVHAMYQLLIDHPSAANAVLFLHHGYNQGRRYPPR